MKTTRGFVKAILLRVLPLALVVSCSSSTGGGIGGTGVSVGPITGFGSIVVNGVHMDIERASVDLEGEPGDDTDPHRSLKEGMVVVVRGTFSADGLTGVASSVEFRNNLQGPVDPGGVDVANSRLMVLGQTVKVNTATRIEDPSLDPAAIALDDLQDGNVVEVSGLPEADGSILATRIEKKAEAFDPNTMEIEIKGTIAGVDSLSSTFSIGGLVVDYGAAQVSPPGETLTDGLLVEVRSVMPPSGTPLTLVATDVEVRKPLAESLGEAGDHAEIEGFVTQFSSLDQPFEVNGVPVLVTMQTQGNTAAIAQGIRVEVDGFLNDDGVLEALKVEIEDESENGGGSGSDG